MSDGPPDISKFLFPAVAALILAGTAGYISQSPIVAAVAAFVGWRMLSGGSVNARNPEHSTPEPDIESFENEINSRNRAGGAGSEGDTTVASIPVSTQSSGASTSASTSMGSAPVGPALARKLARLREAESAGAKQGKSRSKANKSSLKRAEAKLNKALALKEHRAAAKKSPSTAGTSTGTIQRQVKPAADPNVWWLEAFAQLDARMAHGQIDEAAYDREYERIVRRRDAELHSLELGLA